jgi:four helix bundle protein
MAQGSASELEYELLLARDLDLLQKAVHRRLSGQVVEIKKMTTSLIRKLKTDS